MKGIALALAIVVSVGCTPARGARGEGVLVVAGTDITALVRASDVVLVGAVTTQGARAIWRGTRRTSRGRIQTS